MSASGEIVVEREGQAGIIRLNRPKALNSLSVAMVRESMETLNAFAGDDAVAFVVIEGEGERAFCAGGDIRAIHEMGRTDRAQAAAFWREEYELNAAIASFPKPVVVLMRGIVMGGGAGLSIHATHRIVFSDTRFAMPEVGIGFVPDVGSTYRLATARGGLGRYIAYTGTTVGPEDVIAAELADRHVPAERFSELRAAILSGDVADLRATIERFATDPANGVYGEERGLIDDAFTGGVDRALEVLDADESDFGDETAALIRSRSPTSLRLTEQLLSAADRAPDLESCLNNEFAAACQTLIGVDFYEGVRAAVIDKDRTPRWQPASLAEVPAFGREILAPPTDFPSPFPGKGASA